MAKRRPTVYEAKQELLKQLAQMAVATGRARDAVETDADLKRDFERQLDELLGLIRALQKEIDDTGIA